MVVMVVVVVVVVMVVRFSGYQVGESLLGSLYFVLGSMKMLSSSRCHCCQVLGLSGSRVVRLGSPYLVH